MLLPAIPLRIALLPTILVLTVLKLAPLSVILRLLALLLPIIQTLMTSLLAMLALAVRHLLQLLVMSLLAMSLALLLPRMLLPSGLQVVLHLLQLSSARLLLALSAMFQQTTLSPLPPPTPTRIHQRYTSP